MTLKDKFQQWFINDEEDEHYEGMVELVSIEHEQIADEFAIGFAEWMNKTENRLGYNEGKNRWYHFDSGKWITTKELLEIYKKEKGL